MPRCGENLPSELGGVFRTLEAVTLFACLWKSSSDPSVGWETEQWPEAAALTLSPAAFTTLPRLLPPFYIMAAAHKDHTPLKSFFLQIHNSAT